MIDEPDGPARRMDNCLRRSLAEDSIEFAPGERIEEFSLEVGEVLAAIAAAMDEPGMADARVSDESCIGDLICAGDKVASSLLSEQIGRPVEPRELIWRVAAWLREQHGGE